MVVIYNNDTNSLDEVIAILIVATQCGFEEASIETWEAHVFGKASVHFGEQDECRRAASIIAEIGVKTEVTKEWID
ncbi:MAG: ATP-dependent Clp protease adaptor ClpS [Fimbriimonas sp.]|nr:ATP-dependent Clp protease adaptor ClpS [Fimbriimonas sp.]